METIQPTEEEDEERTESDELRVQSGIEQAQIGENTSRRDHNAAGVWWRGGGGRENVSGGRALKSTNKGERKTTGPEITMQATRGNPCVTVHTNRSKGFTRFTRMRR
jgi:hypothetical protein